MASLAYMDVSKLIELLVEVNKNNPLTVRILTSSQLAVGVDALNPSCIIDFSKETIRAVGASEVKANTSIDVALGSQPPLRLSRQSGKYLLDFMGVTTECGSLKELLSHGLRALERHKRGVLEELSAIKPRTKRIVARNPSQLFDQAELSERYSERLIDGWWFGTNNSADETSTWLQRGAELAGLRWGKDISISI